jgi:short-subunit dehydrogenase
LQLKIKLMGLVVVTGASKGIGKAIAEIFALKGYDVAICSRSENDLIELKTKIEANTNQKCFTKCIDVSVKEQVVQFGNFVLSLDISIECLVNNAGVFMPGQLLSENEGALENMINTNLYSAYYLSRILVPKMILNPGPSHVFNICSIASMIAYPQSGSYTISKFALLGFSKSLREELKNSSVKVTSLLPGATLTASWAGVDLPEDRFMKASDIAEIVWASFCLSPSAVVEEIVLRPIMGDI